MRRVPAFALAAIMAATPAWAQTRLVGVARVPSDARDCLGETLGGFGSGMALVPGSWHQAGGRFSGTLAMLPDRGWNTQGTTDYRARLHYFSVSPWRRSAARRAVETGLKLTYDKSLLLRDRERRGDHRGSIPPASGPPPMGLPDLPQGPNGHVRLDDEAVALPADGTIWIGEE